MVVEEDEVVAEVVRAVDSAVADVVVVPVVALEVNKFFFSYIPHFAIFLFLN